MSGTHIKKVALDDVAVNRRRGGEIRVLLSPKTVQSTSGFFGVLTLAPGEFVSEHYHPYSEEFIYVSAGSLLVRIDGDQELTLRAGEGLMVPKNVRHRVTNVGTVPAVVPFHLSPLAPRPELGHVDTEELPAASEPQVEVGGSA
ncbi:cupin domain-containing protein [Phytohabitans aurantiacus]|uniref:Cupin n=1 Tax=Phytohabitans aurantiacus TaxID=3016789 RepID=A0ABQ5R0A7_9ACTN|nr:cupin domain-containing protein [Phytohabitans aurantiacus]GLH99306.1 cupin [Phytohabitans aurantiacus]